MGCGSIGRRHAANAATAATAVEVAVCDVDGERARACAEQLGVPAFPALDDGLAWGPDGVVVATPHSSHVDVAARAVAEGAHALIEKPVSCTLEDLRELLDQADARGRKLFGVCNMRFHPGVETVRQSLGLIGKPLLARASFGSYLPDMRPGVDHTSLECTKREFGGIVLDCIHEFDYLNWMFGNVVRVGCVVDQIGDLGIEGPDYACTWLQHAVGVRSEIHLNYLERPKRRSLEVIGTEGRLSWIGDGKGPERGEVRLHRKDSGSSTVLWFSDAVDGNEPYRQVMSRFLSALSGTEVDLPTARAAAESLSVALAACRSAESGCSVVMPTSS